MATRKPRKTTLNPAPKAKAARKISYKNPKSVTVPKGRKVSIKKSNIKAPKGSGKKLAPFKSKLPRLTVRSTRDFSRTFKAPGDELGNPKKQRRARGG